MNIIGLHILTHNPSATLINDNGEIFSIALERVNRVKNSTGLYSDDLIKYLLDESNLKIEEIDKFIIDKVVKFDTKKNFLDRTNYKIDESKIISINHHLAHAYSTYYASGFNESAILIVDGAGEWVEQNNKEGIEGSSIYVAKNNEIQLISKSLHYRDKKKGYSNGFSIGKFYSKFSKMIGFESYQEGKLMGLAPFGKKLIENYKDYNLEDYVKFNNGDIQLNPNIFYGNFYLKLKRKIKKIFKKNEENNFKDIFLNINQKNKNWEKIKENYLFNAALAQKVVEDCLRVAGQWIYKETNIRNLCVAGGVGLNIDANTILATECGFDETFTLPASEDSGISLGCAYWGKNKFQKNFQRKKIINAYFGKKYDLENYDNELNKLNEIKTKDISHEVAKLISEGNVIGWFSGRSEFGPRALGNRSILADPRNPEIQNYINTKIKKRETFRPFAPVVIEEKSDEYFKCKLKSPFMLLKTEVKSEAINLIPAVVHVDNSSRFQTINKRQNEKLYDLIEKFGEITGIWVLLNTSFNGPGEPIVETPIDAIESFKKNNLDYLVLENRLFKS